MVKAIGENIFPSTPSSVNNGRNTMMMMATEKRIGRPTSVAACTMSSDLLRFPGGSSDWRRKIFSTMTMEASPSMPMAMAIPPRDMRLAERPISPMKITATRAHTGRASATMKALRRLPRKRTSTISTRNAPCNRALLTVPVALSTRLP